MRGCSRVGGSRFPPVHDVSDRLSLPLCYRELLGKAPKETGGVPHSAEVPPRSNGTHASYGVLEGEELHLLKPSP